VIYGTFLKSLKALTHNDANLLCGRTEAIREIVDNCRAERLTVLTSEPGLGVTSVLQAGVLPALRRRGFIVAYFSDWQGRFFATGLKEAIANAVREDADPLFFAQDEPLEELVEHIRARTGKSIVMLFDQFEDYVRCHSNTVLSDAFDAELAHAVATRKGVFVIGLQAHAVPAFERLGQHIPNLLGFHVVLPLLSLEAARDAVLSEARGYVIDVEPAALDELTTAPVVASGDGVSSQDGEKKVHPFYLKVATGILLEAEARLKSPVLRFATILARDGVDRIVLEALDAGIAELDSTQAELLFRWCNILISPETHRLSVTEKGLTEYAGKLNRFVPRLLQLLTGSGVLRTVETPEAIRYELSRECFAPILRDWWERREASIVARRRAVFRITSISLALSAIVLMYVVWLIFGK
jgi:hypothetical protein